jgi:hypothetical protein
MASRMRTAPILFLAAALALTAVRANAQTETIELVLKIGAGEVLYYSMTLSSRETVEAGNQRSTREVQVNARETIRGLQVGPDGTMLLEYVFEDVRATSAGRTESRMTGPSHFKVRTDGRVSEQLIGDVGEDFPLPLPGRPVRAGESWTRQSREGNSQTIHTITLVAVERAGATPVARLRWRTETNISESQSVGTTQLRVRIAIRSTEDIDWAIERGRSLRRVEETTMEQSIETSGANVLCAGCGRTSRRTTTRHEVTSGPASAAPVSVDDLIMPGRAVGSVTLDLPRAAVDEKLGSATVLILPGTYRASSVQWPNGLLGYLDQNDETKILGLQVGSVRSLKTEKGISFGSSEGAVLLAYGMTPTRLDLPAPTGARVLIYNDLGIAFAITSTPEHAQSSGTHAPVGAVDWVTIFSPGGANKIYPLP